jgi:peptidyl-prolyl cis-trans isomerase A (cyclophilin A)
MLCVHVSRAPKSARAFLDAILQGHLNDLMFVRAVRDDNDHMSPKINILQASPEQMRALTPVEHEPTSQTGLRHEDGTVSLARMEPGSASPNHWFVCMGSQPSLDAGGGRNSDGLGFAAFATVRSGMEIIRAIANRKTRSVTTPAYLDGQILEDPERIESILATDDPGRASPSEGSHAPLAITKCLESRGARNEQEGWHA